MFWNLVQFFIAFRPSYPLNIQIESVLGPLFLIIVLEMDWSRIFSVPT